MRGDDPYYLTISICSSNTADEWWFAKYRARALRYHRANLHPGLLAELEELERCGY